MIQLKPLNPLLHFDYANVIFWNSQNGKDPLPSKVRSNVTELLAKRKSSVTELLAKQNMASEKEIDLIDRELVDTTFWYSICPNEIARRVIYQTLNFPKRSPFTKTHAALIILAIAEAGYPITGNGAPDYEQALDEPAPVRGEERNRILWQAAHYWADMATKHITYVSFGDYRGYCPRAVQYDQPGSMNPSQKASLTFGPFEDTYSHDYIRKHTRRLILVR